MGWVNIYRRRMKVFTLAFVIYMDYKVCLIVMSSCMWKTKLPFLLWLKAFLSSSVRVGAAGVYLKALQQREKWTRKSKIADLWEKAHERNAKRVLSLMIELEGLWVKLGQYLSTRADVLPEAYIYLLKQLQDSLPPRPLEEVCQTIEKELGQSMNDLFLDFAKAPLATASIAQVHRATLLNGQEVVVKVQHQGVKTIILEDLKNAKSVVDWIAWAEPQYNFSPMIDEWCKEAPKELDFNREAENTRTVSRNLGCKNTCKDKTPDNCVDVLIPEVIQVLTNKSLSKRLPALMPTKFMSMDFFNGDPHPGNFLVSKDAPHRPILLDFGLTKLLSSPMKQALAKMFLASAEGDHVALLSAFEEMGLRLRVDMPEQAMEVTSVFFRNSTPASEALENMKSLAQQRTKNQKALQEKMKLNQKEAKRFNPVDAFPGDIVIFTRVLNLLRGLSSTMNVRIVYLDIMRPFAESVLHGNIHKGPALNVHWIYDTPVHSDVEAKLRQLLVELGNGDKILGIQARIMIWLKLGRHNGFLKDVTLSCGAMMVVMVRGIFGGAEGMGWWIVVEKGLRAAVSVGPGWVWQPGLLGVAIEIEVVSGLVSLRFVQVAIGLTWVGWFVWVTVWVRVMVEVALSGGEVEVEMWWVAVGVAGKELGIYVWGDFNEAETYQKGNRKDVNVHLPDQPPSSGLIPYYHLVNYNPLKIHQQLSLAAHITEFVALLRASSLYFEEMA
ncbi:ABC1 family protein [Actinidia rufa]|uniref:ABC1 family protein n=1 Tax=Actinidia rufa TaxID=165716 RepID=A0A7J0DTG4_9ERIC|nr:ABC1 family protein [Actinidia rufa]